MDIAVDFGALSSLSGDITARSNAINGVLEDLRSQIASLQQTWQGSSSEGFQQTKNSWNQAADDLRAVLASIGTAVNTAHDNYQSTESSNSARWS